MKLAECPSVALALTPSPASPWSYTTVQERRCDPDVDTNRVSPCSGTSYALRRAKGFRRRQQSSALVERIHQAHRRAYVPTGGKGRGGTTSRGMEGGWRRQSMGLKATN